MASLAPFVVRRGAVYHIRCRTPLDLVALIGKAEYKRSLATTCPKTARKRAALVRASLTHVKAFFKSAARAFRFATTDDIELIFQEVEFVAFGILHDGRRSFAGNRFDDQGLAAAADGAAGGAEGARDVRLGMGAIRRFRVSVHSHLAGLDLTAEDGFAQPLWSEKVGQHTEGTDLVRPHGRAEAVAPEIEDDAVVQDRDDMGEAGGTDAATLAVAMGHRAERTQGGYGRPSRTTKPEVRLVSARATDDRPGDIPRQDLRSRLHPKP